MRPAARDSYEHPVHQKIRSDCSRRFGGTGVQPDAFSPFLGGGWSGVFAAIPLLVGLFFGIEAATEVGGEVRNSRRNIPLGIALAISTAVVVYLLVGGVTLGLLGVERLAASETPILDAMAELVGRDLAQPIVALAAVAAIGTSLNALAMGFSRSLYAMGQSGALPSALGRVHPRFGTPYVALATMFVACILGLFMPTSLAPLFLAVNIPTLLKFCTTCLSSIVVVRTRPELYESAGFKLGKAATQIWAVLGMVMALLVTALGVSTDWRPYLALSLWGVVGVGVYLMRPLWTKETSHDAV